ncbi:DUF4258 domain-containing protein [Crenothrix sp.]|uniref:DUF4258 domain-containing protein n=1 Tax=Crenothrix sp. TaxID=3100433 RepID=UPI00374D09F5
MYELTAHAQQSLQKRSNIRLEWLEQAITTPQLVHIDPTDAELEHRLARIDEFEGRVLRVIVNPKTRPIRVITAFFDRNMRNKL